MFPVLVLGACSLLSWLLGYLVYRFLSKYGVVDKPNERSSHRLPTVRGGGIGIIIALSAGIALSIRFGDGLIWTFVGPAALGVAVVSFLDDLKPIPAVLRFGSHFLAALLALYALGWPQMEWQVSGWEFNPIPAVGCAILLLWITGYTNAFNFMDGINGIAASQGALTALGTGLFAGLVAHDWTRPPILVSFAVAGACLGFLPHNFPTARMFMGDVGSAPLGFLLAVLAVWVATTVGWWLLPPLLLLHANFILDTGITLFRRMVKGEKWYAPHREHFYQRLIRSGKSHPYVTGIEMALQVVVLGLMAFYIYSGPLARVGLISLSLVIWGIFFLFCERLFRRSGNAGPILAETGRSTIENHA